MAQYNLTLETGALSPVTSFGWRMQEPSGNLPPISFALDTPTRNIRIFFPDRRQIVIDRDTAEQSTAAETSYASSDVNAGVVPVLAVQPMQNQAAIRAFCTALILKPLRWCESVQELSTPMPDSYLR